MHSIGTFAAVSICLQLFVVTIQVQLPPTIENGPPAAKLYLTAYGRVKLPCEASGNPPPSYEWYRNDALLQNEQDDKLTVKTEGYYRCSAISDLGRAFSNVTAVAQDRDARFNTQIQGRQPASVGEKLSLPCGYADAGEPNPKFENFKWRVSGKQMSFDRRIQMDDRGMLYFAAVNREDYGLVRKCRIENALMGLFVEDTFGVMIIDNQQAPVAASRPQIYFYSNMSMNPVPTNTTTVVAMEGSDASLRCFFSGSDNIDITWKLRSGLNFPIHVTETVPVLYKSELSIKGVRQTDEGEYICAGTNVYGSSEFLTKLIVYAAPRFLSKADRPRNVNVTVGENVVMRCKPHAEPPANIQWYKDGVKIDSTIANTDKKLSKFHWNDDKTELTINSVCKSNCQPGTPPDYMVIQCNASNDYGYIFSNGYINVFEVGDVFDKEAVEVEPVTGGTTSFLPISPAVVFFLPLNTILAMILPLIAIILVSVSL